MIDDCNLENMSVLKLWAKLQEITIHRRESETWANFYKDRLIAEQAKLVKFEKLRKKLQDNLERKASSHELKELMGWSLR